MTEICPCGWDVFFISKNDIFYYLSIYKLSSFTSLLLNPWVEAGEQIQIHFTYKSNLAPIVCDRFEGTPPFVCILISSLTSQRVTAPMKFDIPQSWVFLCK